MFPSPYGVIFILTCLKSKLITENILTFPSPYGVSFILIPIRVFETDDKHPQVSVSLRSIVHSYWLITFDVIPAPTKFPSPYGVSFILIYNTRMVNHIRCYSSVSVSLWSIIHSYMEYMNDFRIGIRKVSVSLWSYIHSYLLDMSLGKY